ncbi:hypothetical protein ET475_16110 [Microbacterium protaetiae]|uniref:Uncharacterized protein n=1 Tax=Microbacterium protaetiae TaxID=2509458 RepID=A0A4P6EHF3_9MICO|nr:hypothetical protein ET475_16110 [Microbacterium protaetiae]
MSHKRRLPGGTAAPSVTRPPCASHKRRLPGGTAAPSATRPPCASHKRRPPGGPPAPTVTRPRRAVGRSNCDAPPRRRLAPCRTPHACHTSGDLPAEQPHLL